MISSCAFCLQLYIIFIYATTFAFCMCFCFVISKLSHLAEEIRRGILLHFPTPIKLDCLLFLGSGSQRHMRNSYNIYFRRKAIVCAELSPLSRPQQRKADEIDDNIGTFLFSYLILKSNRANISRDNFLSCSCES